MKKILASILASLVVASAFSFPVFAQDETDGDDFITPPPVEDDEGKGEEDDENKIAPLCVDDAAGEHS